MTDRVDAAPSSAPPSSRLPAVSASDILRELSNNTNQDGPTLSTGIRTLDDLLLGGLDRGKTTELWGPRGAGKTAIALTAAVKVIARQKRVIWVACASSMSSYRLRTVLSQGGLEYFYSTKPPSLTHLLALIQHSTDHKVFSSARLLVIDDLNALVDFDYPRQGAYASSSESEARKWQAGRRAVVLATIVSALNRLANMHRLAVVVTNGCVTSPRAGIGAGAAMVPALGGGEWDAGIWNRMTVFQDLNGRFIALQKIQGSSTTSRVSFNKPVLRFVLSQTGLLLEDDSAPMSSAAVIKDASTPAKPKKRIFQEIADSEDEDEYGWEEFEDSDVPAEVV